METEAETRSEAGDGVEEACAWIRTQEGAPADVPDDIAVILFEGAKRAGLEGSRAVYSSMRRALAEGREAAPAPKKRVEGEMVLLVSESVHKTSSIINQDGMEVPCKEGWFMFMPAEMFDRYEAEIRAATVSHYDGRTEMSPIEVVEHGNAATRLKELKRTARIPGSFWMCLYSPTIENVVRYEPDRSAIMRLNYKMERC